MVKQLTADLREIVQEQIQYRELLLRMTQRDLLIRYKQSVMGFGWAIFMPLLNTLIFSVVFVRVAPIETPVPYPLFAYCGLLFWNFFASSLRFAVVSLTSNATLVSKVYFPREVFPLSSVIVCLVDLAVGSLLLVPLMIYYGVGLHQTMLYLPIVLIVHVSFTVGVALLLAMGNLFFRDVKYIFEVLLTMWMFATSVVYPIEAIGGSAGWLLKLNPMIPIIDGYRAALLFGQSPMSASFATASVISLLVLLIGWITFHRSEFKFAESV